jgi:alkaline phosphatase
MTHFLARHLLRVCLIAVAIGTGGVAYALPTNVSITPPDGARFLAGQKFDLRVEGQGTGPFSATLAIDGVPQAFTSGAQNSTTTDGISLPGFGGFNLRGYSQSRTGMRTIKATFTDSTGTVTVSAQFEIVDLRRFFPGGGRDDERRHDEGDGNRVKNIIIMLGDGMGVAHRTLARLVKFGVTAGRPGGFLAMDKFPGTGLVTTHSLNSFVTDSSPGMACYVTGNHAKNGQQGVFPANVTNTFYQPRVEYLAEYLHRVMGKSLGLVTTSDVEDATPAANAVHTGNRNAGTGIVDQYLDESDARNTGRFGTGLTVLMGGGRRWFLPSGQFGSSRSDGTDYANLPADLIAGWNLPASAAGAFDSSRNLLNDFQSAGFKYVDSYSALQQAGTPDKLLGLFAHGNMNVALDKIVKRRGTRLPGTTTFAVDDYHAPDQPMLDEMTGGALRVLSRNRRGFVLMVEGAHIDKQSHMMDADRLVDELIEFDNAVAVSRRFADTDGETLVIVVADHECSGLTLIGALTGGINNLKTLPPDNTTTDPNAQPQRQKVVGIQDSAGFPRYQIAPDGYPVTLDIDNKIVVGFGANGDRYEGWLTKPRPVIDTLLPNDIRGEMTTKNYPPVPVNRGVPGTPQVTTTDPYGDSRGYFIRGQATGREQAVHTAADIPISAYSSSGSNTFQLFYGVQENTDVFFKLMRAVLGASGGTGREK